MHRIKQILPALIMSLLISCDSGKPKLIENNLLTANEVKDFIIDYDKAWERRDTVKMKELMYENYIYFSSVGSTISRTNILGWFNPAVNYKVDTAYRNEVNVVLSGNTAIVNSHWVGSGNFGEEKFNDDQRCGLVIQKINGEIKIISEHCVQIEK